MLCSSYFRVDLLWIRWCMLHKRWVRLLAFRCAKAKFRKAHMMRTMYHFIPVGRYRTLNKDKTIQPVHALYGTRPKLWGQVPRNRRSRRDRRLRNYLKMLVQAVGIPILELPGALAPRGGLRLLHPWNTDSRAFGHATEKAVSDSRQHGFSHVCVCVFTRHLLLLLSQLGGKG